MLQVTYRKKGIKLSHVWFSSIEQLNRKEYENKRASLYYLHGVPLDIQSEHGAQEEIQHSLIKCLDKNEDELFLTLGKHLRQYIKRSSKEDIVKIEIYDSEYLSDHPLIVLSCGELYEKMFRDKNMISHFNGSLAGEYINQGSLVIGCAYIGETPVGFSAVIYDEENARLWVAAFDFRNDSIDSQVLSRGHQRLDWEMLLWCKKHGVRFFDFGGINSFEDPDGISKFKMNFEKDNKVTYKNLITAGNLVGKLALKLLAGR